MSGNVKMASIDVASIVNETWESTPAIALGFRADNPQYHWPVQAWRCRENGKIEWRQLPVVELPPLPPKPPSWTLSAWDKARALFGGVKTS